MLTPMPSPTLTPMLTPTLTLTLTPTFKMLTIAHKPTLTLQVRIFALYFFSSLCHMLF